MGFLQSLFSTKKELKTFYDINWIALDLGVSKSALLGKMAEKKVIKYEGKHTSRWDLTENARNKGFHVNIMISPGYSVTKFTYEFIKEARKYKWEK